ncbi:hypothetical protein Tco_0215482 [Tanacetum coccineum]
MNDFEDMLLLAVQHKLFHLNDSDILDLIVALRMFTRSLMIKRRVEDLQLGVESYQKKLNITTPQKTFLEIEFKELYTLTYKPPGVIYKDLDKQKRVMQVDELYKFLDKTLKTVRDELHHRILNFCLGYNKEMSRRRWTAIDKNRSELMVELLDKQMRERRIIINLERLVGAWELEMDYKLMTRTNQRDLPKDIPLDRIEVLRYDTKGVKVRKGKMQTKTELTLEQTQQGVSDEVLVSIKGVEELKRKVKIKGEKKKALFTLRQKPVTMEILPEPTSNKLCGPDGPYLGPKRDRVFTDLSQPEKDRLKADIRATNILLQGSELTKDDRESQLYDEFEHFGQHKGENIHDFYKVNKGLKESNHDQLYAYLKQHEVHANENKMLMERLNPHSNDPLTLVSNVSPYQYSPSSSVPPQPSYIPLVTYQPQFADNTPLNGRQNMVQGNNARGVVAAGNGGAQNRAGNANAGQGKPIKCYNCNRIAQENGVDLDEEKLLFLAGRQTNTFDDDVDEGPVQDMAQQEDNIFQANQCDAFDSDVDEAPTAQIMFMANLSSADPVYDEIGLSYDSDTLSEVQDHDNCLDNLNESHEEHEMHNVVQQNDVVDSDTKYTSNSNIISYEQYLRDNEDQVGHSDVSSVPNDAIMIITNDIYEQDASITAELARYKELAEVYEKRAQFELTKQELMIDTQMRMIIKHRNVKEEYLQKELHYVKMKLNSTLNYNKLIREEVSTLKHDFKQKENKLLEEFLDMKHLKEKVEDKLYKQDQSLQTVHMLCKPKSFYDEINMVVIGYKNTYYLSKAKQVQPALYNGHEIVKPNHDRALVHDSEDTLEIAETTRKQMIEKMRDPKCVKKKVKIAPHSYSKEIYLATSTPQKQLTPEQIFWSDDLIKMKAKALKELAKSAKPNTVVMVYHPNTPAKLVPKVLLTKRERGFEQTKTCYLTEVIPFFKTIKEHFEEIQKALIQEIKEMKEVFDQMEAEVDQKAMDKKCDEIERKNLLIENENLIDDCLFKEVFYTAINYVLTISRFSEMHDAYTVAQNQIVELEAEISNLKHKIQKHDHDVMIKHFSKLEVEHLNLQLKYQHLKESFGNKKSKTSSDVPAFDSVFVIGQLKEQLQGRGNTIRELKEKLSRLKAKHSEADLILDFKALDSHNKDLTVKVNALQDLNERFRAEKKN